MELETLGKDNAQKSCSACQKQVASVHFLEGKLKLPQLAAFQHFHICLGFMLLSVYRGLVMDAEHTHTLQTTVYLPSYPVKKHTGAEHMVKSDSYVLSFSKSLNVITEGEIIPEQKCKSTGRHRYLERHKTLPVNKPQQKWRMRMRENHHSPYGRFSLKSLLLVAMPVYLFLVHSLSEISGPQYNF